ncbi:beta-glucosidase 44 [Ziziphus jujuba]|uniref:Beta-glucosidase 44 n=1 Tax=Ziziphus jujuba TaxID=326968 RepID=A0ABM3IKT2_ZIZJJ|nr:beta-glucosidase 44 [Ziziphus jujuba]
MELKMRAPILVLFIGISIILSIVKADFSDSIKLNTGGLKRANFPDGFIFGTATSAYQVEGAANEDGRGPSIWDEFVKIPGIVADNATGDVTVDEYHRYKEDIDLMKELKFDAYRFSISWSRIFPNGTGQVNWLGVAYYNRLINYMLSKGITPVACLYHYDLPQALEERYLGLLDHKVVNDFANYADFCFKQFGDRVKNWMTFNEPRVTAALGYDNGFFAPGRCSKAFGNCTAGNSAIEPYMAAHNLLLSHGAAVQRYREKYQKTQKGRIGILLDFVWYEPLTRGLQDEYAAQRARDFHLGWFLSPLTYGEYPKTMQEIVLDRLPKFTEEEVKMVQGSFDYIGINQYTSYYIYNNPPNTGPQKALGYQEDWHVGFAYSKDNVPIGPKANSYWLYDVPWGMYKALMYVKERFQNPTIILSENGMDNPGEMSVPEGLFDTNRIHYYKGYINQMKRAMDDGVNVIGYFAWSILDNFEWRSGFTARFGIVYVDWERNLKRIPKLSAYWFKQILGNEDDTFN